MSGSTARRPPTKARQKISRVARGRIMPGAAWPLPCAHCRQPIELVVRVPHALLDLLGVIAFVEGDEPFEARPNAELVAAGRLHLAGLLKVRLLARPPAAPATGRPAPLRVRVTCPRCERRLTAVVRVHRALAYILHDLKHARRRPFRWARAAERQRVGTAVVRDVSHFTVRIPRRGAGGTAP